MKKAVKKTLNLDNQIVFNKINSIGNNSYWLYLVIGVICLLFYSNTIFNEYALDDSIVITYNRFTQDGIAGIPNLFLFDSFKGFDDSFVNSVSGGRYRPLSLVTFALEVELWGNNPHISHAINVLLFVITCLLLFSILKYLLKEYDAENKWYKSIPFISTILFAAHPIHTEVIANIKGRDEILAFLFSLVMFKMLIQYFKTHKILYLVFSPLVFLLALLSKEIAIVFVILTPLSFYYFATLPLKKIVKSAIPLLVTALFFIIVRQLVLFKTDLNSNVVHDVANYSFAEMNVWQKYATIVYSLGLYVKLLFFPHPLTWDYYPYHIQIMEWSNWAVLLSFMFYISLVYVSIKYIKTKNIFSFAILFFLIPLIPTSNVFFPVGAFMSERFLYISSLGFCLAVAVLIVNKAYLGRYGMFRYPLLVLSPVLLLFAIKTIDRNTNWKNDETLVGIDVKTSKNSLKSTSEYGNILFYKAEKSSNELERKQYYETALIYEEKAFSICKNLTIPNFVLGTIYGKYKNDLDKAAFYLTNVVKLQPDNVDAYNNLGIIYCMTNRYQAAIEVFEQGLKISKDNIKIMDNLVKLYSLIGQPSKAALYHNKVKEQQKINQSLSVTN